MDKGGEGKMINKRTDRIRLLKCLIVGTFILIFIGLIITSIVSAQWPPYNDFSLTPTYSLFDTSYTNYTNSFTSSSFPSFEFRGSENYGNYLNGETYSQYNNNFSPYYDNSYTSSFSLFSDSFNNLGPFPGGLYPGLTGYDPFFPNPSLPFLLDPYSTFLYPSPIINFLPWQGLNITNNLWSPWSIPSIFSPPSMIPTPKSPDPEPADAPYKMTGEWQSQQLTDGDGNTIKGELEYHQGNDLLKILDSSLSLGEGSLTEFKYTPTSGKGPISFKGVFNSGYTASFSGTANNSRCPKGVYCVWAGAFEVEGEYVIKNSIGQIVDKGTFSLSY